MEDISDVLLNMSLDYFDAFQTNSFSQSDSTRTYLKVFTKDYQKLETSEGNSLIYVTEYLLKKALNQHSCDVCQD